MRRLLIFGALLLALPVANAQNHALVKLGDDAVIVPGEPIVETVTTTNTTNLSDGSKRTITLLEQKWRDSQGRFRVETTQQGGEDEKAVFETATILDPTKNTVITLNLESKLAIVFHLPDHGARAFHVLDPQKEKPEKVKQNDQTKVENLEVKKIAGMDAVGTRVTQTKIAKTAGVETTTTIVNERWVNLDSKILLSSSAEDPKGKKTMEVTKLEIKEPDASLFQIPADFAVTDVPLRQSEK
jgi:hypothetical protein